MEATVRDFTALRLREIDRHLRAFFNTTTNGWVLRFTKATGVRACEMRVGFLYLVKAKRGRLPRRAKSINLAIVSKLEEWAKTAAGFESQWAISRPSRFNTRRKSLLPSEDERLSGVATLSPFEQDAEQWYLKQASRITEHAALTTIDLMSNPEPSEGDTAQCNPQSPNTFAPLPSPTDPQACGTSAQGSGIDGTETLGAGSSSPEPGTPTGGAAGETPLSASSAV